MQKVRDQALTTAFSLFVDTWFQVLFHSPYRGSFHLSLTVLVHYRSVSSILPWRVVPPASNRVSRAPFYSGYPLTILGFDYRTFTFFGMPSQTFHLPFIAKCRSYNPSEHAHWFGLLRFRSPLLAESQLMTLPLGT
jgi:hypothetical protein